MTITIAKQGRRHYLQGNTYPIKDALRSAGCKWDGDRRCWWTGKKDVAERFAGADDAGSSASHSGPGPGCKVVARVEYKGKTYYAAWMGMTKRGTEAARLVFRDGSKEFWADLDQLKILKRYGREDYRSGRIEYPTIQSLLDYAAERKQEQETGTCSLCERMMDSGKWAPYCGSGDYDDCPRCGCTVQIN